MRRSALKRGKPLERKTPLQSKTSLGRGPGGGRVAGAAGRGGSSARRSTLKPGRGFSASKAQREKVRGMACVACGVMASESVAIDPAHICSRGMGGCDDPLCVIPLCRSAFSSRCHGRFDEGELDVGQFLEPQYRAEVAHAVTHLGLEGTRRRVFPSLFRRAAA